MAKPLTIVRRRVFYVAFQEIEARIKGAAMASEQLFGKAAAQ